MRRVTVGVFAAVVMLMTVVAGAEGKAQQASRAKVDRAPIIQEWNLDGTPNEDTPEVGFSLLQRRPNRLGGTTRIGGLIPGGVYTFWWIVAQDDGTFPDDIFVASGGGTVVRSGGFATTRMTAIKGQASIVGFMPDGVNEIPFAALEDTMDSVVRIEIAYHGQASDAGDDLGEWLSDFWTGSECPPETPNPNPSQPHCPVYYAATHT